MRFAAFILLLIAFGGNCAAQDIIGFPREDFGKVVLSQKQLGGSGDSELEANIGNYNNEPISKYGPTSVFAKLGRPIGRLDILTDAGTFPCTGFLISEKYLITNYHCVPGIIDNTRVRAKRIEAVQLVLGYIQEGVEENARKFSVSPAPVEKNKELDYAILEVFGSPGRKFGKIQLTYTAPLDNAPYWIIGHPMGEAQRISREGCSSATPAVSGGRLRHKCDTLPGNSGSPVFDLASQSAIALHHAGSKRKSINYAIPFSQILKKSQILQKLLMKKELKGGELVATQKPYGSASLAETEDKLNPAYPFDGKWQVTKSKLCKKGNVFHIVVREGIIHHRKAKSGRVKKSGAFGFRGLFGGYATGKLKKESGYGSFGPKCSLRLARLGTNHKPTSVKLNTSEKPSKEPSLSTSKLKDTGEPLAINKPAKQKEPKVAVGVFPKKPVTTHKPGDSFKDCDECPEMVVAPVGRFMMGSPESEKGRGKDEGPQRKVTIAKAFAVGKFEVTFDEWDACTADDGCGGYKPDDLSWGRGKHPVIMVSWNDAKAYIKWINGKVSGSPYKLLSESEWEYAARAGSSTPFWWGSKISTGQANYHGLYTYNGPKGEHRWKTVAVGSFGANGFGLYNVHGNVWEWVEDCYKDNYNGAPKDGSARTAGECNDRVLRGGSWDDNPRRLRSADRGRNSTVFRNMFSGFRISRTLNPRPLGRTY